MRTGFYPGSFDPFTLGHLDIALQALALCDRLVIAIGRHATKSGLIEHDVRARLIRETLDAERIDVGRYEVTTFAKLAVEAAREVGASMIVRGLRDAGDLPYEMQMAGMNAGLAPDVQTVFLPARPGSQHITATLVRQIHTMGGDVKPFVPEAVSCHMQGHKRPN